jgi:hypothetical protein
MEPHDLPLLLDKITRGPSTSYSSRRNPDGASREERRIPGIVSHRIYQSPSTRSVGNYALSENLNLGVSPPGDYGQTPIGVIECLAKGEVQHRIPGNKLTSADEDVRFLAHADRPYFHIGQRETINLVHPRTAVKRS